MTATIQRLRQISTYHEPWLQRHRATHAKHPQFGTHRHPYLHDLMDSVAKELTGAEQPTMLDYGCGKGAFLREMSQSGRFRFVRGYDPAVTAYKQRPSQVYDLVVCLDVLDQAEDEFVEAIIEDVAQFAGRFAVFDVITVQTPALAHLNPRSAPMWKEIIGRHMSVDQMIVRKATGDELLQGACPERGIFVASRRAPAHLSRSGATAPDALQTYSPAHLGRMQEAHARADGYGRHRHLYLHDSMRRIAALLRGVGERAEGLSWLDYGCGKGGFIGEIRPLGLFATIEGYDPSVEAFAARPERGFDLVTCLDVLDVVEPQFLPNVLNDVAKMTRRLAIFDCLTRPKADSTLRPHPPFYWAYLVGQHMKVLEATTEFPAMEGFERVVIHASPLESA
jgi:2-polyprenyl-3-methyl-5-hydroxy-6-metoxy-1,4-benzoquinol methylase